MSRPTYVLGDIHGQLAQLDAALARIHAEDPEARIVFLGDYVDRGPDARGVLETLMRGQAEGRDWTCLMGNHDRFLLRFLENPEYVDPHTTRPLYWTDAPLGGRTTLASFGVDTSEERSRAEMGAEGRALIAQPVRDWIAALPRIVPTEDHIFVHAGLRPGVALQDQTEDDLVWIREPFLSDTRDYGRLVIHGHTALERPQMYGNRLNMDGGAGYGRPLLPVRLLGREAVLLLADGGEVIL